MEISSDHPIAVRLARFIRELTYDDLPPSVIDDVKTLILDQVACQLIGSTMPWVKPALELVRLTEGVRRESVIVNHNLRVLAADAAFVNATFGQACELDDTAYGSAGHIGTATVPVALAMGEREKTNGRDFLVSIVAGYEVMYRLMAAIRPHHTARGFHSQSIAGPFASAATAGKILDLHDDQLTHALAIAGSHACGSTEYDQSGGEVKRIHAGLGARGGIHSALLSEFGLTGPPTIIEGKRGFCNIFAERSNPSLITDGLGSTFNLHNVFFKVHAAVATVHTAISATARLVSGQSIRPDQIARIRVGVAEYVVLHGGAIRRPRDTIGAQFSLAYSVALPLCGRTNDVADYMNSSLWEDPQIVALMDCIEVYAHPAATGEKDHMAVVTIELKDGRVVEAIEEHRKGTPRNPASKEELAHKARRLSEAVLPKARVDELIPMVERLEDLTDINQLSTLLIQ